MTSTDTAPGPVKSAWLSKINWLQIVALGATFATGVLGAFNLDPVTTAHATVEVAGVGQVLTVLIRTFFTKSLTAGSVGGQ